MPKTKAKTYWAVWLIEANKFEPCDKTGVVLYGSKRTAQREAGELFQLPWRVVNKQKLAKPVCVRVEVITPKSKSPR